MILIDAMSAFVSSNRLLMIKLSISAGALSSAPLTKFILDHLVEQFSIGLLVCRRIVLSFPLLVKV
jgi:hypothetical protein